MIRPIFIVALIISLIILATSIGGCTTVEPIETEKPEKPEQKIKSYNYGVA